MSSRTVVGIDEAGYGPRLGPLVVGVAAFRVPAETSPEALLPTDLAVDDSKRIYRGGAGLPTIERSVLSFARAAGDAGVPDRPREDSPWSLPWPPALPVVAPGDGVDSGAKGLSEAASEKDVEILAVRTRTVGVREFNEGVGRLGTKAGVLFGAAMELLEPFLDVAGPLDVTIDRHGGRAHYSPLLAERFPDRFHWIVGESRQLSTYRFRRDGEDATVRFAVRADQENFATALASMAAKYVRELHMRAFNAWFGAADPKLRPTAGYPVDADRWLRDSADLRSRLEIPDEALVRSR